MSMIDTGPSGGGSQGPWLRWTSEGSARKRLEPESWVLRDKDSAGNTVETNVPAFSAGCVMDLENLKLGWERDAVGGGAPERRWNPSLSQSMPRPDDSKKAAGGYAWSQALSVRLAIGGGKTATWEQGGFGAYEAFRKLAVQLNAEAGSNPGLLPLVQQTGVESRKLPNGNTAIPLLTVVKWVPRPDCLKEGVSAGIAVDPTPAPQPIQQAQPVTPPQPAPFVNSVANVPIPEGAEF